MALQLDLDRERYVSLLEKLIGEVEFLQDNPPPKFVPQEDRYAGSRSAGLHSLSSHISCGIHAVQHVVHLVWFPDPSCMGGVSPGSLVPRPHPALARLGGVWEPNYSTSM